MRDLTHGELDKQLEFAKSISDTSLQRCIDNLKAVEKAYSERGHPVETEIVADFAPRSFYFVRTYVGDGTFAGNGGVIFHGEHDRGGDGGAPTFSVNLQPISGWAIHT